MNEMLIVSMRQDLARVARMSDAPEGYAPSCDSYRKHGRYTEGRIIRALGRRPIPTWNQAVTLFGFTPYEEWDSGTARLVAADLRRVALECGHPLTMPTQAEYREHGHWSRTTVMARLEVSSWNDAADLLALTSQRVVRAS